MNLLDFYYSEQQALNQVMAHRYPEREFSPNTILTALTAEVGEFLQETKAEWCWWKDLRLTDEAKALEEGVDVLFFALTLDLETGTLGEVEPPEPPTKSMRALRVLMLTSLQAAIAKVFMGTRIPIAPLVLQALYQFWPRDRVLQAYQDKAKVNRERVGA